ncbi:DUF2069 domain-containing protein [Limnobacter humi]|uniref:DUF2069 domain-containing protein n=1 Tax=Limnobacter humi TaxID=1778671 RepID=A0ABT1WI33_9BURK|nr:DUF2069 domain-containing protein [Limnobacter humi]MCQ8896377.1 DUF2069 domain-containing protein [Limnobacter humi]
MMDVNTQRHHMHRTASGLLIALIGLCVVWELFAAPLRPGGSWLVLKVLPLLLVLPGLLKQRVRTYQATSLLLWIYFAEGVVRATSDPAWPSRTMAILEVLLCLGLFVSVSLYARTFKKPNIRKETAHHDRVS